MKTFKVLNLFGIAAIVAVTFSSCSKDSSTTPAATTFTSSQTTQVQNSDAQDAVSDRNEQEVDNNLDELQSSNYVTTSLKSSSGISITVDHPDSTTFPKIITIVYTNYQDSTSSEQFIKNGEIDINVSASDNKQLITRAFTFKNYAITTDSTTVSINGTRTVVRTKEGFKLNGLKSLRITTTENISANLKYAITTTGSTDSLKFTRIVSRERIAILHFLNTGGLTWKSVKFKNAPALDTITWTGTVTGVNEKGDEYSKTVGTATPLTVIFYKGTPVVSSGTMELTTSGTVASSYTITFKEDLPSHPFKTLVTVINNTTQKTHSFDRHFGNKFSKWW